MHLADPVKKLTVKGMDFVMGGRTTILRRHRAGPRRRSISRTPCSNNGFNPWSAPGRDMPPFAPKTFNGWRKKATKWQGCPQRSLPHGSTKSPPEEGI